MAWRLALKTTRRVAAGSILCFLAGWCATDVSGSGDGMLRLPGATLLLGWGDVNHLAVTMPTQKVTVLPTADQPEAWNYGSPSFPSISRDGGLVAAILFKSNQPSRAAVATFSIADKQWTEYAEEEHIGAVAISPDRSKVAFSAFERPANRNLLYVMDLKTRTRFVVTTPDFDGPLSWDSEGRCVAYETSGGSAEVIRAVDVASGKSWRVAEGTSPSWSPSGEWIAYFNERANEVHIAHPNGTEMRTLITLHYPFFRTPGRLDLVPVWSPDSRKLLVNVVNPEGTPPDILFFDMRNDRHQKLKSRVPVLGWAEAK